MKKLLFPSSLLRGGLAAALLTLALGSGLRAQGFFTTTDTAMGWTVYFDTLAGGGYRLHTLHFHPIADVAYFSGTMDLDAGGAIVAWDSTEHVGSFFATYVPLPDGDMLVHYPPGTVSANYRVEVKNLNGDGIGGWIQEFPPLNFEENYYWAQNELSELFVLRQSPDPANPDGGMLTLLKFGPQGQSLWQYEEPIPTAVTTINCRLLPTADGGCVYHSVLDGTSRLHKITPDGQFQWADSTSLTYYAAQLAENAQGELFAAGIIDPNGLNPVGMLQKFSPDGQLVWSRNLPQLFQQATANPVLLTVGLDGGVLVNGYQAEPGLTDDKLFFARFDAAGNVLWKNQYALLPENAYFGGSSATAQNGFILAGTRYSNDGQSLHNFILKLGPDGNIYPGALSGRLALDADADCLADSFETGLANRVVQLTNGAGFTMYATTDSTGRYVFANVPGGDYTVSAALPPTLWASCPPVATVAVPDSGYVEFVQDFAVSILADCPLMTVDLGAAALRRCFENSFTVHYCNIGTSVADPVTIVVALDPLLALTGASLPYTQAGDSVWFEVPGAVDPGACGDFTFTVLVSCDAELGQTLCAGASIFPDTLCNPPAGWTGALLECTGRCDGDTVRFMLRNIGSASTSASLGFVIIEDHVIMSEQPLPPLAPLATHAVAIPADGATYRLVAEQEPLAPGSENPSVGVEACGPGAPEWGFFLQFPNRDGNPFTDRDCHEVVGAYDPNDKQAFPTGVKAEHFVEPNVPLDYRIRFQNTGTDTAFTVVIRDTLSPWLDPASVRPGAASHAYTWTLSGPGILTFTFANIMLPDSNVNEPASHGFVQFGVDQRPDNPLGAVLENRAGIYFDFNEPVITNTVFHTIGIDFLMSGTWSPPSIPALSVWPNPADDVVTVALEKPWARGARLVLRNALGQPVRDVPAPAGQALQLQRGGLPAGLYFLELRAGGRVAAAGRVIWR